MSSVVNLRDHKRRSAVKDDPIVRIFEDGDWVEYINLDALTPDERERYIEGPREETPRGPRLCV